MSATVETAAPTASYPESTEARARTFLRDDRARLAAFAHRRSRIMANVTAVYERPGEGEVHEPWLRIFAGALRQTDVGAYVNFLGDEARSASAGPTQDRRGPSSICRVCPGAL